MSNTPPTVAHSVIEESKNFIVGQSLNRILKCLDLLTEEQIWKRPNEETVSDGNLILHLSGDVR